MRWIDEEAAIYVMCQLDSKNVVTKFMSEINFVSPARTGDVVEIGLETVKFGKSSITVKCIARVKQTQKIIITIDKIVFVQLDEHSNPIPHGKADQWSVHLLNGVLEGQPLSLLNMLNGVVYKKRFICFKPFSFNM